MKPASRIRSLLKGHPARQGTRKKNKLIKLIIDEEIARGEIVVVCAWCGKEMYKKPGLGQSIVSHGICRDCQEKYFRDTTELRNKEGVKNFQKFAKNWAEKVLTTY